MNVDSHRSRPEHGLDLQSIVSNPNVTMDEVSRCFPRLGHQNATISMTRIPSSTRVSHTVGNQNHLPSPIIQEIELVKVQLVEILCRHYPTIDRPRIEQAALFVIYSLHDDPAAVGSLPAPCFHGSRPVPECMSFPFSY